MCCVRCCGICSRANGTGRCSTVALVSAQAGRVSPARTQTSAESTTGPIVAAVSTGIDGNGGVGAASALLLHANRVRPVCRIQ